MENRFNRRESSGSFDKERQERSPREARSRSNYQSDRRDNSSREGGTRERRSFNPNFDSEGRIKRNYSGERDNNRGGFERRERPSFNREDRGERSEGGFQRREGGFERRERPSFNREDRGERRDGGFQRREGGFERRERPSFNREDRGERREGGFQRREGGFERRERPSFNREDRGERREGGFQRRDNNRSFDRRDNNRSFERRDNRSFERRDNNRFDSKNDDANTPEYGSVESTATYRPRSVEKPQRARIEGTPFFGEPVINKEIRLNRYIAMSGVCSRREADSIIESGVITVNGEVVTELGSKVKNTDEVCYEGNVIRGEKKVYVLMNKPKGYVTTLEDPNAEKCIMDLIDGKISERIYPVGRLDKNSLGVLLLTNDGDLARELTHPSFEKKKIYHVFLDKNVSEEDLERIAQGVELEDGIAFADEVSYVDGSNSKSEVGIEIHSGRNRVVRRMFEHLGYKVQKLDRVYFAGLTKKNLKRGMWRYLTSAELGALKGGKYR